MLPYFLVDKWTFSSPKTYLHFCINRNLVNLETHCECRSVHVHTASLVFCLAILIKYMRSQNDLASLYKPKNVMRS